MNFFELLRNDHHALRLDLENLIEATTPSLHAPADGCDAGECLETLKVRLIAHTRAEESVFYDRLRLLPHRDHTADQLAEEHHQIEERLEALEKMGSASPDWDETLALLKNELETHLAEEESTIFPILELALETDELDKLVRDYVSSRDLTMRTLGMSPKKTAPRRGAASTHSSRNPR